MFVSVCWFFIWGLSRGSDWTTQMPVKFPSNPYGSAPFLESSIYKIVSHSNSEKRNTGIPQLLNSCGSRRCTGSGQKVVERYWCRSFSLNLTGICAAHLHRPKQGFYVSVCLLSSDSDSVQAWILWGTDDFTNVKRMLMVACVLKTNVHKSKLIEEAHLLLPYHSG